MAKRLLKPVDGTSQLAQMKITAATRSKILVESRAARLRDRRLASPVLEGFEVTDGAGIPPPPASWSVPRPRNLLQV